LNKALISSSFRPKLIEDKQNPVERNSGIQNLDKVLRSVVLDIRADSDGNGAMFVNVPETLGHLLLQPSPSALSVIKHCRTPYIWMSPCPFLITIHMLVIGITNLLVTNTSSSI